MKKSLLELAVWIGGPSWRTSLAGLVNLAIATAWQTYQSFHGQPVDWGFLGISVAIAVGLRFARDHGVQIPPEAAEAILPRRPIPRPPTQTRNESVCLTN